MLMRAWLANCASKHSNCRQVTVQKLPKRLLDLKTFENSDDIRLVELKSISTKRKYVTLSHCWGSRAKQPICTTKATLTDRIQRVRFENLPLTFEDAVNICRSLDQQYLWIDSLCIIQDDKYDWSEQAAVMGSIYGASYVTLAAVSSTNSTQGCRMGPREPSKPKLSRYQDFDFGSRRVQIFEHSPAYWHSEYGDNPYKHDGYGENPLRTRAWTLQERELSLRTISFAQGQLLWQCRTMKGSSQLPWHEMIRSGDDFRPLPLRLKHDEDCSPEGSAAKRDHWYSLVEDYSSRYLTKEIDKLPALVGLASKFYDEHSPGNYFGGIWPEHLPSALLWRTLSPYSRDRNRVSNSLAAFQPRRPQVYRAPSWSWAFIDGEVSYESQRVNDSKDALQGFFDSGIQPNGEDCTMSPLRRIGVDGITAGVLCPDITNDLQFVRSVFVLSVRSEPYHSSVRNLPFLPRALSSYSEPADWSNIELRMGLALLPARSGGFYRRVGLVRWIQKDIFDGIQPVQLRIV
ncbi:heterokaryon incompatibility protein-domain-containing protein [Leptodontidium sp. MPI-SDFR-AT-0119]|nr:heterokaryon incompatibility protein-domain-containing protein [Leptodontidium sp. MPI-SDFR-AT-0119]